MAKVIVERPRRGGGGKFPRTAERCRGRGGPDALPLRQGIRRPWSNDLKGLNENLAPLRRYLRSQAGRPWDKVFSEISRHVNRDSAVQLHVWQHLQWEVCTDPHVIAGEVRRFSLGGFAGHLGEFYVQPRTGLLRHNKAYERRRTRRRDTVPPRVVIPVDETREYRLIDGIWFELKLAPIAADQHWADDVVFRKTAWPAPRAELERYYGRPVYAVGKRQLGRQELRRLLL
jgi:hypothetical protein